MVLDLERNVHACLQRSKLLANEVAILSEPALHIIAVSLEPMDLGSNGVKTLFYSAVVTLSKVNHGAPIKVQYPQLTFLSLGPKNASTSFNCSSVHKLELLIWITVPSMPNEGGRRL